MMSEHDDKPTTAGIAAATREPDTPDQDSPIARERGAEAADSGELEPLLGKEEGEQFRERWQSIQASFVDQPRTSVEQADELVAELMQRLAETFAKERKELEAQWSSDEDVDTESHRVALRHYRSFFERLLSA
jgi:hypothetical protein